MPTKILSPQTSWPHSARSSDAGASPADPRKGRRWLQFCVAYLLAWAPVAVQASMFKGEALDKAADVLAIVILIFVPVGVIALFWMVHVLPEKIAEKRHHPQQTAIKTLCLLSLVFGGLLWPIAWLWAYTKPIGYKMAYGTDKHESYFEEACERAEKGNLPQAELDFIRSELDELATRGQLTSELRAVRDRLAALNVRKQQQPAQQQAPQQPPAQQPPTQQPPAQQPPAQQPPAQQPPTQQPPTQPGGAV